MINYSILRGPNGEILNDEESRLLRHEKKELDKIAR